MKKIRYLILVFIQLVSCTILCSQEGMIDVDLKGNINVIGFLQDSLVLGESDIIYSSLDPNMINKHQNFLLQLDSNKNLNWYRLFGHESFENSFNVESDNVGNVYVSGTYVNYLPIDTSITLFSEDAKYILIKYDSIGNYIWHVASNGLLSTSGSFDFRISSDNNLYLIGSYYKGPFTIGNSDTISNNIDNVNPFVAKFDSSGNNHWIIEFSGSADGLTDLAINDSGDCYLSGSFTDNGPAWFGNDTIYSDGDRDAFFAKCDSNGIPQWISTAISPGWRAGLYDITVNYQNKPIAIGGFDLGLFFRDIPPLISNEDNLSTCIVSYNEVGGENWAKKSAPLKPWPSDVLISMDQNSNIWLTGRCPLEFDDIQIEDQGLFLLKLDPLGNYISSSIIHHGIDVFDLFVDQSNCIYVAGYFMHGITINEETYSGFNENYFISKFDNEQNLIWTYIIKRKTEFMGSTGNISVNKVKIFPNPAQNYIKVEIKDNCRTQGYVQIYSITGEIVIQSELEIDQDIIDISNLANGIYFIQILTGSVKYNKKFIKY